MILLRHVPLWREILALDYLPRSRWLTIGVQDIHPTARKEPGFAHGSLGSLLAAQGAQVTTLDLFDPRADLIVDLNESIPTSQHGLFDVLLDVGSIEHVFDTKQVLINYLHFVRVGGYVCIHTPVAGFFNHGLHTFSPEAIREALRLNGCRIAYERYSLDSGYPIPPQHIGNFDTLLWIVAQKTEPFTRFRNPQQQRWQGYTRQNGAHLPLPADPRGEVRSSEQAHEVEPAAAPPQRT